MWLTNWLRSWKRIAAPSPRPAQRSKAPTTQLFLEPLEDRTLPSAGWAIDTGGSGGLISTTTPAVSQPDANGNTYVTGYFNGTITLGSTTLTGNNASFVAKVDPKGNVLWAEQFGGLAGGNWTGIATDSNGNVYLSGNFDGTQSFGGTSLISPSGSATGYICKVDPNGNFLWAKEYTYQNSGYGNRMAVDGSGNAYIVWDASTSSGTTYFLSKYNTSGSSLWTEQLPSGGLPLSVALDSSGDAYVGGGTFLAKYDTNGNTVWSKTAPRPILGVAIYQDTTLYTSVWPTTALPTDVQKIDAATGTVLSSQQIGSPSVRPLNIAVDTSGNVYLTGAFGGTVDFDPGPGNATVTASDDVFVVKLDPSLNFLSVHDFGSSSSGAWSVAVGPDGSIYTAGAFSGPMTFDTGSQIVSLPGSSNNNLFLVKTTQDTGMIFGQVFNDLNGNGVLDSGSLEVGIPNVTVYLDLNNSGSYAATDPTATTDAQGFYHFTDVTPGNYTVRQVAPSGYTATPASFPVSVSAGLASETTSIADFTPNNTRTYSNTTAVSTSKGKPNATSSLTVAANPDYTVLGINLSLTVNDPSNNTLTIFLTGPNGTKIDVGSTSQSGTLTFPLTGFDYLAVNGKWTLEVDGLGQGGQLTKWSLSVDGTA